jgi:hypothetical protein
MSKGDKAADYLGADAEVLKVILDESDKRIGAQVQLMLAGDLRANGLLAASATLAAAGFAVGGSQMGFDGNEALRDASWWFGGFSTVAAAAAIWTIWPKAIHIQGWSPAQFVDDIAKKKTPSQVRAEITAHNQSKLTGNDACIRTLTRRARTAMVLLALAPVSAAVALAFKGYFG